MATLDLYNPYIITELEANVLLQPHQMDNKIYLHLKGNLERNLSKKCYKNYGYIVEIIKLKDINGGIIEAENTESSAIFKAKFICKLCIPLRNKQIVCKVDKITNVVLTLSNGPILIIVPFDRMSPIFFRDTTTNELKYKTATDTRVLRPNDYIIVTPSNIKFHDGDTNIVVIGVAENIASNEEVKTYFQDQN